MSPPFAPTTHAAAATRASATPAHPGWARRLAGRIGDRLLWKTLGISGFTWLFFIAYFHLLRNPVHPVTVMPLTALDRAVPFQPGWLLPYLSLWLYVGVPAGLMRRIGEALAYGGWAALLCGIGLGCFWLWPTAVPMDGRDSAGLAAFAVLRGVDAVGNACPSMHVAAAVFTAPWADRMLRIVGVPGWLRLLNLAWVLAIVYSTLAVKQHVLLDVVAGTALGLGVALLSLRLQRGLWADAAAGERPLAPRGRPGGGR